MKDIIIVGGGITGLAAAYRLQQLGVDVTLLESTSRLGGKLGSNSVHGNLLEHGPDCFLTRKPRAIALCEELGVQDQLQGRDEDFKKSYILRHGSLHRIPEGLTGLVPTDLDALEKSDLLSEKAISRVAAEREIPASTDTSEESIAGFIIRRYGEEAFDNLIEPLLGGIYAGRAEELSLEATFPQLRRLETEYGSVTGGLLAKSTANPSTSTGSVYPPFVSFRTGMSFLVESLASNLGQTEVMTKSEVVRVTASKRESIDAGSTEDRSGGYSIVVRGAVGNESKIECRSLLLSTPLYRSSEIVQSLDGALAEKLREIPYASSVLVNMAYPEETIPDADGYGYVIPRAERRDALACTWTSRKWRHRSQDGEFLLRIYIGRYGDDDPTVKSDDELLKIAKDEVARTMGIEAQPTFHAIFRHKRGIPQYNLGHRDRIGAINRLSAGYPGLFHAGAAFGGVGIPDCIANGEAAAERIVEYLG